MEAHNRASMAGAGEILIWSCACMSLRITGFAIEVYGFTLHTFLARTAHGGRIEDNGRLENKSRDMEDS